MKNKQEHLLISIHVDIWILMLFTFDFLTKRNEFAVWDNDYFDLVCLVFIGFLIFEFLKLKEIGFKNHIESLTKKTLNWYIGLEILLLSIVCLIYDDYKGEENIQMPYLLNIELAINLVLSVCFISFFLYLRFKKKS